VGWRKLDSFSRSVEYAPTARYIRLLEYSFQKDNVGFVIIDHQNVNPAAIHRLASGTAADLCGP
jgi:hypothetical protein